MVEFSNETKCTKVPAFNGAEAVVKKSFEGVRFLAFSFLPLRSKTF